MFKSVSDRTKRLHVRFLGLKRFLRVHKKCSNLAFYGGTGRFPLAVFMAKQMFGYYKRLKQMETNGENSIAGNAFKEQHLSQLAWYRKVNDAFQSIGIQETSPYLDIEKKLQALFNGTWKEAVESSPKLRFYLKCKAKLDEGIGFEPYFDMKNHSDCRCLVQLRTSSHRQKIETGRCNQHLSKATLCETKRICQCRCDFWTSENVESPCQFSLMLRYPSLKTNVMSLYPVQKNLNIRSALHLSLIKSVILRDENNQLLFTLEHSQKFWQYVIHIFELRFPKVKQKWDLY